MRRETWPALPAARDRFVLSKRGGKPLHDPQAYQRILVEDELTDVRTVGRSATVFLTGRECPWRCVMCDLWRFTTSADTPAGAIAKQVCDAREAIRRTFGSVGQIKLYNASNFFDPKAVPEDDYEAIAGALDGIDRVVVECHPALVGRRVTRFLDVLQRRRSDRGTTTLEVAMGLETAHPEALERLNKRMTVEGFASAAQRLLEAGAAVRVFLLISPPFVAPGDQEAWLVHSVEAAFSCGASVVSLVPTRTGNGALEAIGMLGDFTEPDLGVIERSMRDALRFAGAGRRVFADLWDLERFARCGRCLEARRDRLQAMNLCQRMLPPISCERCGGAAA